MSVLSAKEAPQVYISLKKLGRLAAQKLDGVRWYKNVNVDNSYEIA